MDLSLSFLAGLFGSMHCVGMCGAIVIAYSTQQRVNVTRDGRSSPLSVPVSGLSSHLVYNAGRVLSYAIIGALVGFLGGTIAALKEIGAWFSILAGAILVIWGVLLLNLIPRRDIWAPGHESWLRRIHIKSVADLLSLRSLESKLYVGLLTPFLPCGLLYAMFIKAASSGSSLNGMLTMLVFGLGIVPALLLTGLVSTYIGLKLRHYANKLAAVTIVFMGIIIIARGAGVPLPFMDAGHESHMPHERPVEHHHP